MPPPLAERMEFFQAVDGNSIPEWKAKARFPGLGPSQWAVRLTKLLLLREFLQNSASEYLCLYEDDVVFAPEFEAKSLEALEFPDPWECIFLGGTHSAEPVGDGPFRRCVATFNNHCLLMSRTGARKIRSILTRPWLHEWSDREIEAAIVRGELDAFCPEEFVAYQRDSDSDNLGPGTAGPRLFPDSPWMRTDDAHVLFAAAFPGATVVEWGSGGSTALLARRVGEGGRVISFEHKLRYFQQTQQLLGEELSNRVHLHLIPPRPERQQDDGWRYLPGQMDAYVSAPLRLGVKAADLAFVDGRERISCALAAAKVLKPGGLLLIHDFWGRQRYRDRLPELLENFDYEFETPESTGDDPQGLAVFSRR